MNAVRRITSAAAVVLVVTGLVLVAAGPVAAASPSPTVGGRLAAVGNEVTVTSQGSLPTHVRLTADVVVIADNEFDLAVGGSRTVTFTGDAVGRVYATFSASPTGITTADMNSLVLSVGLKPYTPPFSIADFGPGGSGAPLWIAVLLIAITLLAIRLRVWRWRIVTTPAA